MTRVRLLTSGYIDADVRAHVATINALTDVVGGEPTWVEDSLPRYAAAAARLFRDRRAIDVVITFGEGAMTAAGMTWRGSHVHVATSVLSRIATPLVRGAARRENFRLVTASAADVRRGSRTLADARTIRLIRPDASPATMTRDAVRQRLGVADDAPLIFIPGLARRSGNHRLALWATGILAFRDPSLRTVVRGGGNDAMIRRFATATQQARNLIVNESVGDADLARAADVAIFDGETLAGWTPLVAARAEGLPIVALSSMWHRERFADFPARLVPEPKARRFAIAALRRLEARGERVTPSAIRSAAAEDWRDLLHELAPARRTTDAYPETIAWTTR